MKIKKKTEKWGINERKRKIMEIMEKIQ